MAPIKKRPPRNNKTRKPSSVAVGDRFEKQVYNLICTELEARRLFLDPTTSVVFQKKKYWSNDRNDNIIVDISIESTIPEATDFSLLTAIECKKYSRLVPVDDVEEFHSKIRQIAGVNVKGIIVSHSGFQEGAVTYARSNKIALVRTVDNKGFTWVLTRAATGSVAFDQVDSFQSSVLLALTQKQFAGDNIDFFAVYEDVFTNSAWRLFETLHSSPEADASLSTLWLQPDKERHCVVPFLPLDLIDHTAEVVLQQSRYNSGEVDVESISRSIARDNGFSIEFVNSIGQDNLGSQILGEIAFSKKRIRIARTPHFGLFSRKFTVAHELGHILLDHDRFLKREVFSDDQLSLADDEATTAAPRFLNLADIKRVEWQANHFASSLLLPHRPFVSEFHRLLSLEDVRDRGHGVLYVDDQECNSIVFLRITNKLREIFRVSRKVIEIRLRDLQLLSDLRKSHRDLRRRSSG